MSVVLTVISLGTRVALAYALSAVPALGVAGIWWSVPIGWFLADAVGLIYYRARKKTALQIAGAGGIGGFFPQAGRWQSGQAGSGLRKHACQGWGLISYVDVRGRKNQCSWRWKRKLRQFYPYHGKIRGYWLHQRPDGMGNAVCQRSRPAAAAKFAGVVYENCRGWLPAVFVFGDPPGALRSPHALPPPLIPWQGHPAPAGLRLNTAKGERRMNCWAFFTRRRTWRPVVSATRRTSKRAAMRSRRATRPRRAV